MLIATGSEVNLALDVANELQEVGLGVRVVSMPCQEIFDEQPISYKQKVLSAETPTFSLELSSDLSFLKYIKNGEVIGVNSFGKSGSPKDILKEFNLDSGSVAERIKKFLKV